ncbi:MAG: hypothetical protein AAF533_15935 [Acidobacteriota bacterium]
MGYDQPDHEAIVRQDDQAYDVDELLSGQPYPELEELSRHARLSYNVYCTKPGQLLSIPGWSRRKDCEVEPQRRKWTYNVSGLHYEVWASDDGHRAAIVYRGTNPDEAGDWFANARWATRFIPRVQDQYLQAASVLDQVLAKIKESCGESVRITVAGHSLGGGLAQHAAYRSTELNTVYAFHPSPVTGYYSVPRAQRDRARRGTRIFRMHERGEVLTYPRLITKATQRIQPRPNRDPLVVEIRFKFQSEGHLIELHDMKSFALEVSRRQTEALGEHHANAMPEG